MNPKFTEEEINKRLKKARPLSRGNFLKELKDDMRATKAKQAQSSGSTKKKR